MATPEESMNKLMELIENKAEPKRKKNLEWLRNIIFFAALLVFLVVGNNVESIGLWLSLSVLVNITFIYFGAYQYTFKLERQ